MRLSPVDVLAAKAGRMRVQAVVDQLILLGQADRRSHPAQRGAKAFPWHHGKTPFFVPAGRRAKGIAADKPVARISTSGEHARFGLMHTQVRIHPIQPRCGSALARAGKACWPCLRATGEGCDDRKRGHIRDEGLVAEQHGFRHRQQAGGQNAFDDPDAPARPESGGGVGFRDRGGDYAYARPDRGCRKGRQKWDAVEHQFFINLVR